MSTSLGKRIGVLAGGLMIVGLVFARPAAATEDGAALFKSKCAMCHGPDGGGKTMMGEKLKIPDLRSADVQKKSDGDLRTLITKGKDKMPAYETKATKEQIDALVAFVRSLCKK